jgi:hypothetical protein
MCFAGAAKAEFASKTAATHRIHLFIVVLSEVVAGSGLRRRFWL